MAVRGAARASSPASASLSFVGSWRQAAAFLLGGSAGQYEVPIVDNLPADINSMARADNAFTDSQIDQVADTFSYSGCGDNATTAVTTQHQPMCWTTPAPIEKTPARSMRRCTEGTQYVNYPFINSSATTIVPEPTSVLLLGTAC